MAGQVGEVITHGIGDGWLLSTDWMGGLTHHKETTLSVASKGVCEQHTENTVQGNSRRGLRNTEEICGQSRKQ